MNSYCTRILRGFKKKKNMFVIQQLPAKNIALTKFVVDGRDGEDQKHGTKQKFVARNATNVNAIDMHIKMFVI